MGEEEDHRKKNRCKEQKKDRTKEETAHTHTGLQTSLGEGGEVEILIKINNGGHATKQQPPQPKDGDAFFGGRGVHNNTFQPPPLLSSSRKKAGVSRPESLPH